MGIFNYVKQLFNKNPTVSRVELISELGNGFYAWNGELYESDIVRSCIRPFYKSIGKLFAKQIREAKNDMKINPDAYIKLLLEEPNPYMTGQMLQEKMAINLALNNNAFAYIKRNEFGYATEIYHIPAVGAEALYDEEGYLFIKFILRNGKTFAFPYTDIIHLRQDYNTNDVFGEDNTKTLAGLMNIVKTTDIGIIKAIKNSACIRWLLKYKTVMKPEDIKKNTDDFVKAFLNVDNNSSAGAAAVDNKADVQQVEPKDYVPNAAQMDKTVQRIYNYFGTNEKIIQSKCNEDEWNSYYELVIEPIAIQFSNEYTRKIFSMRERAHGNKIVFESNCLQYASMATKLKLVAMVDRGALTPNEWRGAFNFGVIEGGNKAIRRLDTKTVKEVEKDE